jgi:hypothetical protein
MFSPITTRRRLCAVRFVKYGEEMADIVRWLTNG